MKKTYWIWAFALLFLLGCDNNSGDAGDTTDKPTEEQTDDSAQSMNKDIISDILQSIPSPLEISQLIKEVSTEYNVSNLNEATSVNSYNTSYRQALNLGVYSTDLGYCNLYNKNQDILNYLNSVKKLANDLGIGQYFDYETIKRLANSKDNLDSLLNMTQKNFERINGHLQEEKREYQSILILTGGWVEAVYLTTLVHKQTKEQVAKGGANVAKSQEKLNKLKEKIGEQKLTLEQILLVLDIFKTKPNFGGLITDLKELQKNYARVEIVTKQLAPKLTQKGEELIIEDVTDSQVNISEQDLEAIASLIQSIRNKIIKN
jgi:hypothetical protein